MKQIDILKELSTYTAVSGYEKKFSGHLSKLFEKYCDEVQVDKFNNIIGIKKGTVENKCRIMLSAHLDEIGLMVKSIDENGFVKFTNIGGIDSKILLAQEVTIHGKKELIGVIGAKPPHLLKPEDYKKAVKLEDLSIDVGMKRDEVTRYISIGDIITFRALPFELQGNKLSSKSIDNRCGVAVLLEAMKELYNIKHESDACFVATSQEEVGLRGVTVAAYNLEPDMAIVIDACHGDMPDAPKDEVYALGKGPAIAIGPNLHRKFTRRLMEFAKEENISYQTDVEPGDTGTEAWATQVSRSGIPTILLSIPVRYMHTTIETVSLKDIINAGRLIARFILSAEKEMEEILCH